MRRLTESTVGLGLVILAGVCASVGIADNMADFSQPETWLLTGLVFGILAIAVAIDEQRLSRLPVHHAAEEWLARSVIVLSILCALTGWVFGVVVNGEDVRELWSVMAVILALLAVSVTIDAHRVAVARHSLLDVRHERDAIGGVLAAALAFGLGVFGMFTGLFGLPHAQAWLFAGVVFAVIAVAFMFDEQVHVAHRARRVPHRPFSRAQSSPK